jgi:hypothetical protein
VLEKHKEWIPDNVHGVSGMTLYGGLHHPANPEGAVRDPFFSSLLILLAFYFLIFFLNTTT